MFFDKKTIGCQKKTIFFSLLRNIDFHFFFLIADINDILSLTFEHLIPKARCLGQSINLNKFSYEYFHSKKSINC